MYTCIIIDDQREAVDLLTDHAGKIDRLTVKLATTDPVQAMNYLDTEKPDIVFTDIQMPEATGIDLVENLKQKWGHNIPVIVFTTGYSEFAVDGYAYGVFDYLLKPVTFKRFKQSVDRIFDYLAKCGNTAVKSDFLFADVNGEKLRINFGEIVYVEGARNYVIIHTAERKLVTYASMTSIQDKLPGDSFIRIHKSYIIAAARIESVRGNRIMVRTKDLNRLPIGITYKKEVMRRLNLEML